MARSGHSPAENQSHHPRRNSQVWAPGPRGLSGGGGPARGEAPAPFPSCHPGWTVSEEVELRQQGSEVTVLQKGFL